MPSRKQSAPISSVKQRIQLMVTSMKRIQRYLQEHEDDSPSEKLLDQLKIRQESIAELFSKYQEAQIELSTVDDSQDDQSEEVESLYYDVLSETHKPYYSLRSYLGLMWNLSIL